MHASRPRLGVAALALVGALVAIGLARWRSQTPVAPGADAPPPAPPAVPPNGSDLRPAPARTKASKPTSADAPADAQEPPPAAADDGKVLRRVHVRLPDGSDAREGTVVWCEDVDGGLLSRAQLVVTGAAHIGPGGLAELRLDPTESLLAPLFVTVPGRPNVRHWLFEGGEGGAIDVAVPEGVPCSGRVVDPVGRGVPDLPILITSTTPAPTVVLDEDVDVARLIARYGRTEFVHVETRTDAAGRFAAAVPKPAPARWRALRVLSRDARWFVTSAVPLDLRDPVAGGDVGEIHAARGIALDVDVTASDFDRPPTGLRIQVIQPLAGSDEPWSIEFPVANARERLRMLRLAPEAPVSLTVVTSLDRPEPTHTAAVARVTYPIGVDEARIAVVLDSLEDVARTGLVEMFVPEARGAPDEPTGFVFEVTTTDAPPVLAAAGRYVAWASTNRVDARVATGTWRVVLRVPNSAGDRDLEARVEVAAGSTTRATMTPRARPGR